MAIKEMFNNKMHNDNREIITYPTLSGRDSDTITWNRLLDEWARIKTANTTRDNPYVKITCEWGQKEKHGGLAINLGFALWALFSMKHRRFHHTNHQTICVCVFCCV